MQIEIGSERLRELVGVRSQIDYHLFITKLLKEENKQILTLALSDNHQEILKLKMSQINDHIELKLKASKSSCIL